MKFALLAASALFISLASSPAKAEDFTKEQIQEIVREYLIDHPEVMMDAMIALKEYQVQQSLEQNGKLVEDNKDKIFNDPGSASIGPKDAKVTLVEFYDYNCGACKIMYKAIIEYLKEDKNFRVVFKEYPIFGENSEYPARIATAVHLLEPEKSFEFHKTLMDYQGRVTPEVADQTLDKLGLDKAAIKKEAAGKKVAGILMETRKLADTLGATGTPLVVVGNEIVPHALDIDMLREKVRALTEKR